jgi:hypothetical protein
MDHHRFGRPYRTEGRAQHTLLPSDESLGYCQPTLRVEVLAVSSPYESEDVGKDKA